MTVRDFRYDVSLENKGVTCYNSDSLQAYSVHWNKQKLMKGSTARAAEMYAGKEWLGEPLGSLGLLATERVPGQLCGD